MSIGSLSLLLPVLARADVLPYPGQNDPGPIMNQPGYQTGVAADSGAGVLIIGIIVYFLFFKKSK